VVVSAHAGVPALLFTQTCRLAITTSGVSVPVLALTASLTEVSMRKSLLIALLPVFLCSGMIGGTFLLSSTSAQHPQQQRSDDLRSTNSTDSRTREPYSVPLHSGQKWEYKTIRRAVDGNNTDAEMNSLGEQGWELSGTNVINGSSQVMLIFKRPKQATVTNMTDKDVQKPGYFVGNLVGNTQATFTDRAVSGNTEYRQFHLQRSSASDVADVLKKTFAQSTIVCDARTNSLHVQSDPKVLAEIKQVIQKLEGSEAGSDPSIKR